MTPVYFLRSIQKETKQKGKIIKTATTTKHNIQKKRMKIYIITNKYIKSIAPPIAHHYFTNLYFMFFKFYTIKEKQEREIDTKSKAYNNSN